MTAKEAIKFIRKRMNIYEGSCGLSETNRIVDNMAIDALEREEKYRWHDLRKNPDDLPEREGKFSICVLADLGGAAHEAVYVYEDAVMYYGDPSQLCFNVKKGEWRCHGTIIEPIAWKEIKPFEEVE